MSVTRFLAAMRSLNAGLGQWDIQPLGDFARQRAERVREQLVSITERAQGLFLGWPISTFDVDAMIISTERVNSAIQTVQYDWRTVLLQAEVFADTIAKKVDAEEAAQAAQLVEVVEARGEEDAEQKSAGAARYANATLKDPESGARLDETESLRAGQRIRLQIDIGGLSQESHVTDPQPLPPLPDDAWIDVVVSSNDFVLEGEDARIAAGSILLPKRGPARTQEGADFLAFDMTAPARRQWARCRASYYYRDALLQSHRLTAAVGRKGGFRIETDFSALSSLRDVSRVPEHPRVSLLTNYSGENKHEFVLRAPGSKQALAARTFIPQPVDPVVKELRKTLRDRAPSARARNANLFRADLEALARLGWQLYAGIWWKHSDLLAPARERPGDVIIQVGRPTDGRFTAPWGLLYDIQLEAGATLAYCPLVDDAEELKRTALSGARCCPHEHERNVLCPFGFWGYRYRIEQISTSDSITTEISAPSACEILFTKTNRVSQPRALADHLEELKHLILMHFADARVEAAASQAAVRSWLDRDLPIIYFYCHGARAANMAGSPVCLSIGDNDVLASTDIFGWIDGWSRKPGKKVWDKVRPLVFINACHSLEITSESLTSYLDVLVGRGGAAGVIGTEVRVNEALAREFATLFFGRMMGGDSVDAAIRSARLSFLADRNLFGLVYTPYCWADLRFA